MYSRLETFLSSVSLLHEKVVDFDKKNLLIGRTKILFAFIYRQSMLTNNGSASADNVCLTCPTRSGQTPASILIRCLDISGSRSSEDLPQLRHEYFSRLVVFEFLLFTFMGENRFLYDSPRDNLSGNFI